MTKRTYTDPFRRIVSILPGAGSDVLTFECGHKATRDHRANWGGRSRCHGCRVWQEIEPRPQFDKGMTGPLRIIEEVRVAAFNAWDTLALDCGHSIVRAHQHKWGRRTRCPRCHEEGRS